MELPVSEKQRVANNLSLEEYKRVVFRHEKGADGVALVASFKNLHQAKDSEQKKVLDKIRLKLDEYNTALVKCNEVKSLAKPRKSDLKFIRKWLYGQQDGEGKGFITKNGNVELLTWNEDHDKDFTAVNGNTERDIWSSRIVEVILAVWHSTCGRRRKANKTLGVVEYTGLESITKLIVTMLSAMVPAVSIVALYFEKNLLNRIWIMMGLTLAFAAILSIFTGAKRIEVFSATAAFAAVEVIFIGSTDVGNKIATGVASGA
ncbi:uncharacterized protein PAC_06535 [Phialocephala subalpina]|uniref:DUF6594 domain-containing protein n=1 Tax=Phialocephala subalpina TaxID=576137 RepID=A0A1L7WV39_9HELO|nr:uncharacterized protein PAC_06535 [Phialocephala subalpina]